MSKQREWQRRMIAEGKCMSCAAPRNLYAAYCDDCMCKKRILVRNARRRKNGIPLDAPVKNTRPRYGE